jgi:hypothetical protein
VGIEESAETYILPMLLSRYNNITEFSARKLIAANPALWKVDFNLKSWGDLE